MSDELTRAEPLGVYHRSLAQELSLLCIIVTFEAFVLWSVFTTSQPLLETAVGVLGVSGLTLFAGFVYWRTPYRITLYNQAIKVERKAGVLVIPWSRIQVLSNEITNYGKWLLRITVERKGQKPLSLTIEEQKQKKRYRAAPDIPVLSFHEFAERLYKASYNQRLEWAKVQYNTGERVDFGEFAISVQGFHTKRANLSWDEVASLNSAVNKPHLVGIKQRGRERAWRVISLYDLNNADILAELIHTFHPHLLDFQGEQQQATS